MKKKKDSCRCCHINIETAHQACCLTQLQCTDTRPTSPCTDPIIPGTGQGTHESASFEVWYDSMVFVRFLRSMGT